MQLDFRADEYDEFSPTAIAVIDAMFDRVNKVLDEQSQPFLGGATLGADDIILAAHASWLFFPDELGKPPRYRWHLGCILLKMPAISLLSGAGTFARSPSWEMLPKRYRGITAKWRSQPAGQLVLRLYREHRDFGPAELLVESDDPALYPGAAEL